MDMKRVFRVNSEGCVISEYHKFTSYDASSARVLPLSNGTQLADYYKNEPQTRYDRDSILSLRDT
jgi:hypothetical protein